MYFLTYPLIFSAMLLIDQPISTFVTGNDLLSNCSGSVTFHLRCVGYIQGVADTMQNIRAVYGLSPCPPGGVTERQIEDVVISDLRANATTRDQSAASLIVGSIVDAWKCPH